MVEQALKVLCEAAVDGADPSDYLDLINAEQTIRTYMADQVAAIKERDALIKGGICEGCSCSQPTLKARDEQ